MVFISALQTFGIAESGILTDDRFGGFLIVFDEINRLGDTADKLSHHRPLALDDRLPRHHAIAMERYLQTRHADQITQPKSFRLSAKGFTHDRKLGNALENRRETLGIHAHGHNLHVLFRIDAQAAHRQTKPHLRYAAKSIDETDFPT